MTKLNFLNKESEAFKAVRKIVNKYDPLGILSANADIEEDDEYDSEVVEIINRCWYLDEDKTELAYKAIKSVFEYWFWDGCCKGAELMDVAVEIVDVLKRLRRELIK
ncbi:hypothetical protein M2349_000325 [Caldanaerobacter subterraneus subsp. tengcongensis MB4]|uniref:Uncharacterized protein n=1 Tax=Caldanaerobacter subterraneus subsp. tengcongensis (strain DSM 15242 / JCM 11007 / NBRC 100824 / MB4) TaxID=273068 RepID=Q8R8F8_CALS4|nr:hypothetical protein [Caldanaerobacter subterraneus]AAM25219.1 hypothetical protein TTE2044 [Caldanaerobacter subterraneus subsp. tengcongensis MB4]MCS3915184.1 hypothetical protein [Caldanaerobacter subterraneus subsp. tengcongensis MB4]